LKLDRGADFGTPDLLPIGGIQTVEHFLATDSVHKQEGVVGDDRGGLSRPHGDFPERFGVLGELGDPVLWILDVAVSCGTTPLGPVCRNKRSISNWGEEEKEGEQGRNLHPSKLRGPEKNSSLEHLCVGFV
jgi:hypothetical protein